MFPSMELLENSKSIFGSATKKPFKSQLATVICDLRRLECSTIDFFYGVSEFLC